jgi:hypothetical protein
MREPTYLIIVALASMLVALPFSASAQRERGPLRLEEPRLEERRLEQRTPLQPQTFGGLEGWSLAPSRA